jgi:hypothetical protein
MFINGMLPFSAFYDIMRIYHKKQGAIIMNGLGTIIGGGVGSGIGTAITETLNNTNKPPLIARQIKKFGKPVPLLRA